MDIVKFNEVTSKIVAIRGKDVILDSDVAELYSVETREVNQAVKNNPKKFPQGFVFELSTEEKKEVVKIFDNPKIKFSPELPKAFTKKGCYMLATILSGDKAIDTTIAIIEAFEKLSELQETVAELSQSPDEYQQKSLMQKGGEIISELLGDGLKTSEEETSIELNFAVLKFKHTVKEKNDGYMESLIHTTGEIVLYQPDNTIRLEVRIEPYFRCYCVTMQIFLKKEHFF